MNGLNLQQMMAMMQQGQAGGGDTSSSLASLCSFKAGRCTASPQPDGSLKITPMKGKGTLNLTRTNASHSEGEGMIHLQWEDRKTKETPDKFIIFPSEAKFEEIQTGTETDTPVCMLSYMGNSERRNFYWVQELEFDKENINEINTLMNDPAKAKKKADPEGAESSAPPSSTSSPTSAPASSTTDTSMDVVSNDVISSANLPADTSVADISTTTPSATTPAPPAGGVDVQNLQSILSGLGLPAASSSPSPTASITTPAAPAAPSKTTGGITLSDLQSAMSLAQEGEAKLTDYVSYSEVERQGLLENSTTVDKLTALLPEGQRTKEDLVKTLRSPQVLSALGSLSNALNGPEFASVLANFDLQLGEEEQRLVAEGKGVEAFIRACEKKERESK
ncbi:hypothetical protein TrLO_g13574 [Triparma laevis f. longispina]|uniref:Adhesion regulating molecule 1 n=2 Tax=Triparma laevis TaxID=1534972 RepID=A0A9W7B3W2_9STRA|nr:hypothetical protein TrLO_g13574 [Triparma laevis f. longispina]